MHYSDSDLHRIAQMVDRDAMNIKVVSSNLIAVKVFLTFPVETLSLESILSKHYYQVNNITIHILYSYIYSYHIRI